VQKDHDGKITVAEISDTTSSRTAQKPFFDHTILNSRKEYFVAKSVRY
jgi:hypothetical protein